MALNNTGSNRTSQVGVKHLTSGEHPVAVGSFKKQKLGILLLLHSNYFPCLSRTYKVATDNQLSENANLIESVPRVPAFARA